MNTKTIRGKTLGIFLSLVLVLSMAAVMLPAMPVHAATIIAVTQPNGGDCVKGGGNYLVKWTETTNGVVTATIAVSTDNGANWTDLTSVGGLGPDTAVAREQTVTMPNTNSGTCLIKVTISGPSDTATPDQSDAVFKLDAQAPSVTLGSPLGSECWQGGSGHNVTWLALDNFSDNLTYTVQYSVTGGSSWTTITTIPPSLGGQGNQSQPWTLPGATNASNCRARVTATDCAGNYSTATSSNFTIDSTAPVSVIISQPNGGETLTAGASYNIQWTAVDNLSGNLTYQLAYSTGGCGGSYTNIGSAFSGAQGGNTYAWTVPGARTTGGCVRVTATDCSGLPTTVNSAGTFTIQDTTAPVVTVTSPNGGESWVTGSVHNITWTATDNVPGSLNYYLFYCTSFTDCPTCSIPIAGPILGPQSTNSFPWTVPTPVPPATTSQCRVKVEARDLTTIPNSATDCSNNNFTIVAPGGSASVTLTSPNGGESWQGGTSHVISWNVTSSLPSEPVTILLEYDAAGWHTIVNLPNRDQGTGSFSWAVPDNTAIDLVRVTATVSGLPINIDVSDAVFTVTAAAGGLMPASIVLRAGWNLISLQLMPTCTSPDSILADYISDVESVWYYTSSGWQFYTPGGPYPLDMTDGKAYWVKMTTGPHTITYQGRKCPLGGGMPSNYAYPAGWNMVGFKSTSGTTKVKDYLGLTCGTTYTIPIYCWDATGQVWCTPSPGCEDFLIPGQGYWVKFLTAHEVSPGCD